MNKKNDEYVFEKHQFVFWKAIGKQVCVNCGLVAGNNKLTSWCIDKGCNNSSHPMYRKTVNKLTKPKWEDS